MEGPPTSFLELGECVTREAEPILHSILARLQLAIVGGDCSRKWACVGVSAVSENVCLVATKTVDVGGFSGVPFR